MPKRQNLVKNQKNSQKIWSKIKNFLRKFSQKFWSKIEIVLKAEILLKD